MICMTQARRRRLAATGFADDAQRLALVRCRSRRRRPPAPPRACPISHVRVPPKCLTRPRTDSSGWAGPPRSRAAPSAPGQVAIMPFTSIAERKPSDRRLNEIEVMKIITPGSAATVGLHVDRRAQRVQHQAPFRLRRLGPEAEERQARRQDHRHADQAGRVDEDRSEHVAEHVHADDGQRAGAARARRLDVVAIADLGGDALGDARRPGGTNTTVSATIALRDAGAERARQCDREQDRRERVEHVDGPHHQRVHPSADIAGHNTRASSRR